MSAIQPCNLPAGALLCRYEAAGAYTDCYATDVERRVSIAQFVEAFYTTAIFKAERLVLRLLIARPSSDAEARQLALGERDTFAAWSVEARASDQLLLADLRGRTRSWLMVTASGNRARESTRLFFGSAVVPANGAGAGRKSAGNSSPLLALHKLYSRILLQAARSRLAGTTGGISNAYRGGGTPPG
jgi:hypothetical protein